MQYSLLVLLQLFVVCLLLSDFILLNIYILQIMLHLCYSMLQCFVSATSLYILISLCALPRAIPLLSLAWYPQFLPQEGYPYTSDYMCSSLHFQAVGVIFVQPVLVMCSVVFFKFLVFALRSVHQWLLW
jgi:hypothetical protein